MKRVLVIGAGPAGLAAATRLLEEGRGETRVTIAHMGHHLGGKAASYVDASHHETEHGWHMVVGFYDRMRGLMKRAGVDERVALASMRGQAHPYERFDGRVHDLDASGGKLAFAARFAGYDGMPADDRAHFSRFMAQTFLRAASGEDLTQHDDVCFDTWAVEHGLRPHLLRYSLFRALREGYFNFPEQISAYHVLQTLKLMGDSERSELFVCRGGWSDLVWGPIAKRIEALGGVITPYVMATDWIYEGRKITGVRVAAPDPVGHDYGAQSWSTAKLPIEPGSERTLHDFDFVVSTVPNAVFVTMNASDDRMWSSSYFKRMKNLRSVATIAMKVTTKRPAFPFHGPVFGLPAPLGGTAVNMTEHLLEKPDGAGSVISFVGQETGFESWTDDQIASFTLDNLARASRDMDLRAAEITSLEIHRNRADFERFLLCEPGVNAFRPGPRTPFSNLFLAGDWVRNEIDVLCMEGAIASGYAAADEVLGAMRSG